MRPAYLEPKLTDTDRSQIRRLRRKSPHRWTLSALAGRFGVNKSTISRALSGSRRKATLGRKPGEAPELAEAQPASVATVAERLPSAVRGERRAAMLQGLELAIRAKESRRIRGRLLQLLRDRACEVPALGDSIPAGAE